MVNSDDIQKYLQRLHDKYQHWWKRYSLIDEEDELFDFRLEVQTEEQVQEDIPTPTESEKKTIPFPVLDGINRYVVKEHILLVGQPGSGKSTALARFLLKAVEQARQDPQAPIPVLIELRRYKEQSTIQTLIQNALRRLGLKGIDVEELRFDDRPLLLLLDGLNELPSKQALTDLRNFREDCADLGIPMVVTTRELNGDNLGIKRQLEMKPLTPSEIQRFLQTCLPQESRQRIQELSDRLRELGRTPLMLWMLYVVLKEPQGEIPDSRGELFRRFIRIYERKREEQVYLDDDTQRWWTRLLKPLAFEMMRSGKSGEPTDFRLEISKRDAETICKDFLKAQAVNNYSDLAIRCLDALINHHLIQFDSEDQEIEFCHQLLQEYYAAEWLLERLPELSNEQLKYYFLNYLKWTEAIGLMLGLIDKNDFGGRGREQVIRVVKLALGIDSLPTVDLALGARLAGKAQREFHEDTIGLIHSLELQAINGEYRIVDGRLFSRPKIEEIIEAHPELKDLYEAGLLYVPSLPQALKVWLLGLTSSEAAIPYLLNVLSSIKQDTLAGSNIRDSVINQLVSINTARAYKSLLQLYYTCNSYGKFILAYVLAKNDNPQSTSVLEEFLSIEERTGEENVAKGIRKAAQEKQIRIYHPFENKVYRNDVELDGVLNAKAQALFWNLYMLWLLGDFWAFYILMKLLKNKNFDRYHLNFLMHFRYRLSEVNEENLHKHYLKVLEAAGTKSLILYLGLHAKQGNQNSVSCLTKWLKDERFEDYHSDIVRELSEVKNDSSLSVIFLEILEENYNFDGIRLEVLDALQEVGAPEHLSRLVAYLLSEKLAENAEDNELDRTLKAIADIQKRCGFYNYELAQPPPPPSINPDKLSDDRLDLPTQTKDILEIIFNTGVSLERSSREVRSLPEESLRDWFVNSINAKYPDSATPETRNKNGKTDILVRITGKNILIVECKFWKSYGTVKSTLDQLLYRYTTIRDTQLAMLIFNRDKNFTDVKQKIPDAMKQHPSFVREVGVSLEKAWYEYVIFHPDDRACELNLTVLAFHISP